MSTPPKQPNVEGRMHSVLGSQYGSQDLEKRHNQLIVGGGIATTTRVRHNYNARLSPDRTVSSLEGGKYKPLTTARMYKSLLKTS
jgi:hypothetical protein